MPKTKTKKSTKPQRKCKFKCYPLTGILIILVIGLAVFSGYLFCNRKTNEEKKRLQAFETIVADHILKADFLREEYVTIRGTGIGITKDNDLYVDFEFIKYDEAGLPLYVNKGREHYQCGDRSGKVIENWELPEGCSRAYWYDEPKYIDQETRNKYQASADQLNLAVKQYNDKMKAIYGAGNYTETEDGIEFHDIELTEEQEQALKAASDEFREKQKFFDDYNSFIESIWNYL